MTAVRWRRSVLAVALLAAAAAATDRSGDRSSDLRSRAVRAFDHAGRALAEKTAGGYQRAAARYAEAAHAFARLGDARAEAQARSGEGLAALALGDHAQAAVHLGHALDRFRALGDRAGVQAAHTNLGLLEAARGQPWVALAHFQDALDLARAAGDTATETRSLTNLGALYTELGATQAAVDAFRATLEPHRQRGDRAALAASHNDLGVALLASGAFDEAVAHLESARRLYRETADPDGSAEVGVNLAIAAWRRGDARTAEQEAAAAADAHRARGDRAGETAARLVLARLALDAGERARASPHLARALVLARTAGDRRLLAATLRGLAAERAVAGDHPTANRAARLGLRWSLAAGDAHGAIDARMRLARLADDAGRREEAIRHAEDAAHAVESLAGPIRADRLALGLGAEGRAVFTFLVDRLATEKARDDPGRAARVFAAAERGRTHALHTQLRRDRGAASASLAPHEHPSADAAERFAALLGDGELALAYVYGEERVHLLAVDRQRLTLHDLDRVSDLDQQARRWHTLLAAGDRRTARAPVAVLGDALSRSLLAPVAERLATATTVVVIPDGALHYLPFAALPLPAGAGGSPPEPLGLARAVVRLPSARAAAVYTRIAEGRASVPGAPRVAAVAGEHGDDRWPALPYALGEAEAIARLAGAGGRVVATRELGRHDQLTSLLASFHFIHFATHARIDDQRPARSGLRLGDGDGDGDGFLRLDDLERLQLEAELVSLGACRTGLGREVSGAGLVGLARGFQAAGVPRVVVSLWDVGDQATATFMVRFYRGLLVDGRRPPEALRAARRHLAAQPRWQAPAHWAAFTLVGDWR